MHLGHMNQTPCLANLMGPIERLLAVIGVPATFPSKQTLYFRARSDCNRQGAFFDRRRLDRRLAEFTESTDFARTALASAIGVSRVVCSNPIVHPSKPPA